MTEEMKGPGSYWVKRILQLAELVVPFMEIERCKGCKEIRVPAGLGYWRLMLTYLRKGEGGPILMKAKAYHKYRGDIAVFSYRLKLSKGADRRLDYNGEHKINIFNGQVPELLRDIEKLTALDQLAAISADESESGGH